MNRRQFIAGLAAVSVGGCTDNRGALSPEILATLPPEIHATMQQSTRLLIDATDKVAADPALDPEHRTLVLVSIGQSLAGNHSGGNYRRRNRVDNLCTQTGKVYQASGRLLGCSWLPGASNSDNFLLRLGDKLIDAGIYDRVILVPLAVSGSTISSWAPGGINNPLIGLASRRIDALGWAGCEIVITQQQGESDHQTSEQDYLSRQRAVIGSCRDAGLSGPFLIAHSTCFEGVVAPHLRAAQVEATAEHGVFIGADTDSLDGTYRYDRTHLNERGAEANADLWLTALSAAFQATTEAG